MNKIPLESKGYQITSKLIEVLPRHFTLVLGKAY